MVWVVWVELLEAVLIMRVYSTSFIQLLTTSHVAVDHMKVTMTSLSVAVE